MDAVEEVKSRLSIEDVIGEYVQLKRAGHNFRGLSPFNSEKTPSFMVSPEKQIWHDFSSNKGGNMFSFIMEMEGVDFKDALELLAKKAGVDLDNYRRSARTSGPNKQRLLDALEAAAKFYQVQLKANNQALDYVLKQRRLTKQTVLAWQLGYSPNTGSALGRYLSKLGFSDPELRQAGLITYRGRQSFDMFRGRIMIPLMDPQGLVIGFTARLLEASYLGPKYINTPQTPLYDKSRHVFGLHLAKNAIREQKFAVIAEGNLDVISSHQAGVLQTVATAGTALTEAHLKTLTRFTSDIRLCFDGDKAGIAATERAIGIASKLHVSLNIIDIKGGKDPDELIKTNPELWTKAISQYSYAVDWLIERQQSLNDLSTAEGKRLFTDAILPTINNLDDAVEQDHYLNQIASKIGISRLALAEKSTKTKRFSESISVYKKPKVQLQTLPAEQVEAAKSEDHLLALVLLNLNFRDYLKPLSTDMFSREESRQLADLLLKQPTLTMEQLNGLDFLSDYVKIEALQYEELYQGLELSELKYEAVRLQARLIEYYVKRQKQNITLKLKSADEQTTDVLLKQASQLDKLLRVNLGEVYGEQD
jgi:DNA primase